MAGGLAVPTVLATMAPHRTASEGKRLSVLGGLLAQAGLPSSHKHSKRWLEEHGHHLLTKPFSGVRLAGSSGGGSARQLAGSSGGGGGSARQLNATSGGGAGAAVAPPKVAAAKVAELD